MSYQKIELPQGSPEWLKLRSTKITASSAHILFELDKKLDTHRLFLQMAGLREPEAINVFTQQIFDQGHKAEPIGRTYYEDLSGLRFPPAVVQSVDHDFMMASLDGINEETKTLFEHKMTISEKYFVDLKNCIFQPKHMIQVQMQMGITGAEKCVYFMSLMKQDKETKEYYYDSAYQIIDFDPAVYAEIVAKSSAFMSAFSEFMKDPKSEVSQKLIPLARIKTRKKKEVPNE